MIDGKMRSCLLVLLTGCLLLPACVVGSGSAGDARGVLRLAVGTTTRDSGLLDELVAVFEREYLARVDVIATGTGRALSLGETGDVDVLLVHSREAEERFMSSGHGVRREEVMHNRFVLLGPAADPARIAGLTPAGALRKIAVSDERFVSRGDESGTHQSELRLWRPGGGPANWSGYLESGRGMGATLIMADQMSAYVLSDHGTYLRFRSKIDLVPLVSEGEGLHNPYGIIAVDSGDLAGRFVDFVVSPRGQQIIREFTIDGEPLFLPNR
jgi:tungstate transport system substrate-binding protein